MRFTRRMREWFQPVTAKVDPDGFALELEKQLRWCHHGRMRALRECQYCDMTDAVRARAKAAMEEAWRRPPDDDDWPGLDPMLVKA